jgi:hypothetical protein
MSFFTYQQWSVIGHCYIPLMALLCAVSLISYLVKYSQFLTTHNPSHLKATALQLMAIIVSLSWVYGLMFLDNHFKLWPSVTIDNQPLDYSTHTALAWVFSCFLYCSYITRQAIFAYLSLVSMVLYLMLMKYQNYHTFADMFTTTIVVLPLIYYLQKKTIRPST